MTARFTPLSALGSTIPWGLRYALAWVFLVLAGAMVEPIVSTAIGQVVRSATPHPTTHSKSPMAPSTDDGLIADKSGCPQAMAPAQQDPSAPKQGHQVIQLDLRDGHVSIKSEMDFKRCSAEVTQLLKQLGPALQDWQRMGHEFLMDAGSEVDVDGALARMAPPQVLVDATSLRLTTQGQLENPSADGGDDSSVPVEIRLSGSSELVGSTDFVIRSDPSTRIWTRSLIPTTQSAQEVQFLHLSNPADARVMVAFASQSPKSGAGASATLVSGLVRAILREDSVISPLWLGLTYALPFLVFMLWSAGAVPGPRLTPDPPPAQSPLSAQDLLPATLRTYCALALTLIFGLVVADFVDRIVPHSRWLQRESSLANLGWVTYLAQSVFVSFAWPAAAAAYGKDKQTPAARWLTATLAALTVTLYCVTQWRLHTGREIGLFSLLDATLRSFDHGTGEEVLAYLQSLLLVLGTFLSASLWVGFELGGARSGLRTTGAVVLGLLVIIAFNDSVVGAYAAILWLALAITYAWAFSRISLRWVATLVPTVSGWPRGLTLAASILFVVLLAMPPEGTDNYSGSWLLTSAAWCSVRLWQLFALTALLLWLKSQSELNNSHEMTPPLKGAGAVFMIVMFYWRTETPLIPLLASFAAGLFVQTRWLWSTRRKRTLPKQRSRVFGQAIAEIGLSNDLSRAKHGLRKAIVDKVSSAKATVQDYLEKTSALDQAVKAHEFTSLRARCRVMLALNSGPHLDPWERGLQGAMMALILSVPWMVSYFWNLTKQNLPQTNAYAVSEMTSILLDVGRWPALGFFFLYFYPQIRGYNGIQKGLTLTVALVAPTLAATVLWSSRSPVAWITLLFWSLQAFICCMTIGVLLGDITALRRAGKGPRSLLEVYNFGILAAWSSSIAIAIGAAATTALTSGVGSLFAAGIKMLLPESPLPGK